jgi:uncharacterized protein (TIGR02246 family)
MSVTELDDRIRRLEDREEIHALLMAYRRALDEKDFQAYAALFARDGVFTAGSFRATGPGEIVAMLEAMVPEFLAPTGGDDLHLVANVDIEVRDDGTARATSTWVYLVRGAGDVPELSKLGHYEDELRREDGRWRFALRHAPTVVPA